MSVTRNLPCRGAQSPVNKRKNRKRSHSEVNVAVGFQRSLAISAKDLTTVDMISAKGMHLGPDSARIGGVGGGVNMALPLDGLGWQ